MPKPFRDRTDAGRQLAPMLLHLRGSGAIVLALPRGGVPVGYEVAHALEAPLDVLNVRKLGVPWHEELAMGAIAGNGIRVLNADVLLGAGVSATALEEVTAEQMRELLRRERLYRGARLPPVLRDRSVILVDDGIATAATVRAAIVVARAQHPKRLVLAAPVAQSSTAEELENEVDELMCVIRPSDLYAIGTWYDDFGQLTDDAVRDTLSRAFAEEARRSAMHEQVNGAFGRSDSMA